MLIVYRFCVCYMYIYIVEMWFFGNDEYVLYGFLIICIIIFLDIKFFCV